MAWKKLSEKQEYKGFRTVMRTTYLLPDGSSHDYDIILVGNVSAVFAVTEDNKILVEDQFRPGPKKVLTELPAGFIEEGETPEECARRELLEETGYEGDFTYLGSTYLDAYSTMIKHHFIATNCRRVKEQEFDDGEALSLRLVSLEEFKGILEKGDMTTAVTAYKALECLRKNKEIK